MGGLRCSSQHHGKIIATTPPQVRTLFWHGAPKGEQFIFPHTLFVAYYTRQEGAKYWLNRLHVSFSLTPIDLKNQEQPIYGLPLANTDVGNAICFYEWPTSEHPEEFMKKVIAQFWASPFQDYGDGFSHWLVSYGQHRGSGTCKFRQDWQAATARRDWKWLWDQTLLQAPYVVNLRKLIASNKTISEETDWFPNIGTKITKEMIEKLAEQKWRDFGCPDEKEYEELFMEEAEAELKKEMSFVPVS
jgi:hypothetical protein